MNNENHREFVIPPMWVLDSRLHLCTVIWQVAPKCTLGCNNSVHTKATLLWFNIWKGMFLWLSLYEFYNLSWGNTDLIKSNIFKIQKFHLWKDIHCDSNKLIHKYGGIFLFVTLDYSKIHLHGCLVSQVPVSKRVNMIQKHWQNRYKF